MSDLDVLATLDRLERLLGMPLDHPNGAAIAQWRAEFDRHVAAAERGPRWPEVKLRAKVLGVRLSRRMALIQATQDRLKRKLNRNAKGSLALRAYQSMHP